ncbi:hypothetical protein UFOVP236_42 [uncultured Caudovirales phage]|uniref:Uncharacterized protein n=1 Tax=uncultured Caudovirales phage TaxID=2100421 RepID=A0A6J7WRF7_9CAUD|nr:hypothetical protein UFOVP236_42 [uncultured Caudovirales phage]
MAQDSRIGAGVTYVYAVASASTQSIAAEAKLQQTNTVATQVVASVSVITQEYQAGVSYVIPSAMLSYVSIVLQAELDPIGRNPFVNDIFVVGDLARLSTNKGFTEVRHTSDTLLPFLFGKGLSETLHAIEVLKRDISKTLSENLHSQDDFNASVPTDDGEVMTFGKHVPDDAVTKSDVEHLTVGKRATENQTTSEQKHFDVTKGLSEYKLAVDYKSVTYSKPLFDSVDAGDEMNAQAITDDGEIMIFGKRVTDSFTQSDESTVQAEKGINDPVGSSDELLPFVLGKGIADIGVSVDQLRSDYSKPLADTWSPTDFAAIGFAKSGIADRGYATDGPAADITYAVYGYFAEDYVFEYFPAKSFFKSKSESLAVGDVAVVSMTFNRTFAELPGVLDLKTFGLSKPLADIAIQTDLSIKTFYKSASDSVGAVEYRSFDFSKSLSESLKATDDFYGIANADDDETMLYSKNTADSVSQSETQAFAVSKALADTVAKSDVRLIDLSKAINDAVAKSDAATKASGKSLSDSFLQSDANSILVGKGASDSASSSDAQTRLFGKSLSDTATKSDNAVRDNSKALADTFTKSDSIVNSAGKVLADTATTGETKTFSISKSLADTVHPTDAYQHLAISDDDENMLFGKISNDVVLKSDLSTIAAGKALTDSVSKSDSGSLVWTDYWDINYTVTSSGVYVGNSKTF